MGECGGNAGNQAKGRSSGVDSVNSPCIPYHMYYDVEGHFWQVPFMSVFSMPV
jgi:hypothetical protein